MALVVEDGTGLSTAESYASVAEADAYAAKRGYESQWLDLDADVKEQSLRKATDYMVINYRELWLGGRVKTTQALCWPRDGVQMRDAQYSGRWYRGGWVLDSDVVPQEVKNACIEFAVRAAADDLLSDEDRETADEMVGPLRVIYRPGASRQKSYPAAERWLSAFLTSGGGGMAALVRA